MRRSGFTLIELLMASVVLAVLAAIAIPNFTRMQKRAKEAEVKSVAHVLQMAVEDYKTVPTWLGMKPSNLGELTNVQVSYMPNNIQVKQNPFNPAMNYGPGGNGIQFGAPGGAVGVVYYDYVSQSIPYTLVAFGGDNNVSILTLQEGE